MPSVQGATRRKSDKTWRDALIRALGRRGDADGFEGGVNKVADAVVSAAIDRNDKDAWKEIGDRLDGKPSQAVEHSGPDGEAIPVGVEVIFVGRSEGQG